MYPDADHNATTALATSAKPAEGVSTSCWIGSRNMSTADAGTTSEAISMTASVVRPPWPKTPSSDTITRSAGNSDSTA